MDVLSAFTPDIVLSLALLSVTVYIVFYHITSPPLNKQGPTSSSHAQERKAAINKAISDRREGGGSQSSSGLLLLQGYIDAIKRVGDKCEEREALPPPGIGGDVCIGAVDEEEEIVINKTDWTECPVCLEEVAMYEMFNLPCCGGQICYRCYVDWFTENEIGRGQGQGQGQGGKEKTCVYCRQAQPRTYKAVIATLTKHVKAGKDWAELNLGQLYYKGFGLEQSHRKALHYFLQALDKGSLVAPATIAFMYHNGRGVERSVSKALDYFLIGHERRNAMCTFMLGKIYEEEMKDYTKAVYYYNNAACQGNILAQFKLGCVYFKGLCGLVINKKRGYKWLLRAADARYQEGHLVIACLHQFGGRGSPVERDIPKAIHYYKLAAQKLQDTDRDYSLNEEYKYHDQARYQLGYLHSQDGPTLSNTQTVFWFRSYLKAHSSECMACEDAVKAKEAVISLERELNRACSGCGAAPLLSTPLKICNRCKLCFYCSVVCQKSHWGKGHKEDCDMFASPFY